MPQNDTATPVLTLVPTPAKTKRRKARKTREAWGRVRKFKSGRYQASYQGPDLGIHKASATFDTLTDARGWLQAERTLIDNDEWTPPALRRSRRATVPTFAEYADRWVTERDLKPSTRAPYQSLLRNHFAALDPLPLNAISEDLIRSWYATLAPGHTTAKARAYGLLKTILGTAVEDKIIKANPVHIRGAGKTKRAHKIKIATTPELDALAGGLPARYRALVHIGAWAGLRWGELTELRRRDLDITPGPLYGVRVSVERGVTRAEGRYIVGDPKSDAGIRTVTVPPHIVPIIIGHLAKHVGPDRDALLFPAATDPAQHLSHSGFNKLWRQAAIDAGIPGFHIHDLRHHGATRAAIAGATTAELQRRIGHATPAMASLYQHALDDRDSEIARKLSDLDMAARKVSGRS